MNWKEKLRTLEQEGENEKAVAFMQTFIATNPDNMDAWMFMNYLLVNLQTEEQYDTSKSDEYWALSKKYFKESYAKFSENAEYLYFTAKIAVMGEWLFGITVDDYEAMFKKAKVLDPKNLLYKEDEYREIGRKDPTNLELIKYAEYLIDDNSVVKKQLETKGALGEYVYGQRKRWAQYILKNIHN